MKSSRYYQNIVQIVGSISEAVLFLSGFFLGKELFAAAAALMLFRIISKIVISEFVYKRLQAVVTECGDDE